MMRSAAARGAGRRLAGAPARARHPAPAAAPAAGITAKRLLPHRHNASASHARATAAAGNRSRTARRQIHDGDLRPPSATAPLRQLAGRCGTKGELLAYSAAWHHRHLYDPRSVNGYSIMPSFRFLYEKRRVTGERAADALQLAGVDAPEEGWEIVPTYEAQCARRLSDVARPIARAQGS